MKSVEFKIEKEMLQEIKKLANENETSPGVVVRDLLTFGMEHAEEIFGDDEPPEDLEENETEDEDD